MSGATVAARRPTSGGNPILGLALMVIGGLVTTATAVSGNGSPILAMAPIALAIVAYVVCIIPVRHTLFALIFLSLTLDAVDEGPWNSPLAPIGSLLANNLNKSIPISALVFPGVLVVIVGLLALLAHRSFVGSGIDSFGRGPTARPLLGALGVSLAAVLVLCTLGVARSGDSQMAKIQVQSYVMVLMMGFLASMSLRDKRDYRTLGRVIVAAAAVRSLYMLWVLRILSHTQSGQIHAAATHGDSLLLAAAAVLLIFRFLEKPSARSAAWCVMLLPLLALAMDGNNRRLVWVELAAGLLVFVIASRPSRMKRLMAHVGVLMLPFIIAYIVVGWNSQSRVFAPIKMYRSVSDGKVDPSTLYRDLENYNLMMTMRIHPLTGMGFGQPFAEIVTLPSIAGAFREYRYMPHNSILGLWAFTGPLGFTGLSMALVVAIYLTNRSYRLARFSDERTAALMAMAMFAIYLVHCWGDIGFSERRSIFLVGPALAIAGQLACATGAWKSRSSNPTRKTLGTAARAA